MASPLLKRFLISLNRNWLYGLLSFAVVLGGAIVLAKLPDREPKPTTYKAVGRLALSELPPSFTDTGTKIQEETLSITEDILLSPGVLQRVAKKWTLLNNRYPSNLLKEEEAQLTPFPSLQGQESQLTPLLKRKEAQLTPQQALEIIQNKRLNILFPTEEGNQKPPEGETAVLSHINVEYTDLSEQKAQLFLEAYMKAVVENSRWVNTSQLRTRIQELEQRLVKVKRDLAAAEKGFYGYITTEGSSLLAVQDGSLVTAITDSQKQQRELRLNLEQMEGQIGGLSKQLGLSADQAYTSSALSADPIIANLRASILQNERELDRLSRDLRPEHPAIIQLRKQLAVDESQWQKRVKEVISDDSIVAKISPSQLRRWDTLNPARQDLANQLVALRTQREGLLRQMELLRDTEQELRHQFEQFPTKQLEQARLAQEVESQRTLYQTILTALTDARAAEAETLGSITIDGKPYVESDTDEVKPKNPVLIISLGAGLGLVIAAGVIFWLALVDDKLYSSEEIQETLVANDVPLLGELPFVYNLNSTGELNPALLDAEGTYIHFYERFRSNLRRLGLEYSKMVIVTSTVNEEGKSVTAYNLAIASAHAGKRTLLIEADLRSSSQVKWLELDSNPQARQEPLRYYGVRNEAISLVPEVENLYVIPSPGPQRQAAAIVESSELKLLLKDVRGRFDMVVIDTPSLARCNDALLLERITEGTIGIVLVTRPGISQKSLLGAAIEQLIEAEVPLLGAVINGLEDLALTSEFPMEMVETELERTELERTELERTELEQPIAT